MGSLREEIERRLQVLPELPFFASITDPKQYLSPIELARAPHLVAGRAFIVQRVEVDRTNEQPGIWLQTLQSRSWPLGVLPKPLKELENSQWISAPQVSIRPGQPMWINAEWCIIYGTRTQRALFPN